MAGQVVPLGGFEEGEYRLASARCTDLLSGKSLSRDVLFTVGPTLDRGIGIRPNGGRHGTPQPGAHGGR